MDLEKSIFLKSLAEGDIGIPESTNVYLLNEGAPPTESSAIEYVVKEAEKKNEQLDKDAEKIMESEGPDSRLLDSISEYLDPSTFETRATTILKGLGFTSKTMKKKTKDMSGGARMRVALGCALFLKPDLLLLDEPTNNLDSEAVVWLGEHLSNYDKILVVISHSRDFLNKVCTNIIDLTTDKKLVYYDGNYDKYVKTKQELETNQMKAYNKQQEEITNIRKFIASAGTYANDVKQAKSKQKELDKMEAAGFVKKVEAPKPLNLQFEKTQKLSSPVIEFNDVSFAYSGAMKDALYQDLDFKIGMDSRIAIVGKNGTGKSTLLRLIMNNLKLISGNISRDNELKVAIYSQHSTGQLSDNMTPLQWIEEKYKTRYPERDLQECPSYLDRFGISGSHQTSEIRTLSEGLRFRVVFAALALEQPDILLLDEITNNLDMQSIDALAQACNEFTGGVVLVSHDFYLVSQIAKELWEVKDKKIQKLDKTIDEYKESVAKELRSKPSDLNCSSKSS